MLVAAPTGSGKTIVGEFAVHLALAPGPASASTPRPIKALSNQKYADLAKRYGADKVGLLTGDNSVNSDAPVVVMTTEVLRNMLYAGSQTLIGLGYVVMDEVHYLSDRFRGAVWEEVIIHLPESVTLVSLSATVSNAEEFGDWLDTVRGDTEVIVSEHRPVPLWQHVLAGRRMYDLFEEGERRPQKARGQPRPRCGWPGWRTSRPTSPQDRRRGRNMREADRERERRQRSPDLDAEPARGHRAARRRGPAARHHLHLQPGRLRGRRPAVPVRRACGSTTTTARAPGPRDRRGAHRRHPRRGPARPRLLRVAGGPGARHRRPPRRACCRPSRRSSRSCSSRGLVKAVFATETLALGINMPARSVVLEKLVKWNGEQHADITPGEYTQLTGRAGRRGIDVEGHAVVLWQRGHRPGAPGRARRHPHVPAALQLQAVVQHGGQPGRPVRAAPLARAAGDLLRAVPGRPLGRRHLPAGAAQRGGPGGLPGRR